MAILRQHIARYGLAPDGRLFRSEQRECLYPSSYRYVWQQARPLGLTPAQVASPLVLRPYDLRPRRRVAAAQRWRASHPGREWAGHSVEVLLTIYAKCIHGRDQVWFTHIDRALRPDDHD